MNILRISVKYLISKIDPLQPLEYSLSYYSLIYFFKPPRLHRLASLPTSNNPVIVTVAEIFEVSHTLGLDGRRSDASGLD